MGTGNVEVGQVFRRLGLGVEDLDVADDLHVALPVRRLQIVRCQNVDLLAPGRIREETDLLGVARAEEGSHRLKGQFNPEEMTRTP